MSVIMMNFLIRLFIFNAEIDITPKTSYVIDEQIIFFLGFCYFFAFFSEIPLLLGQFVRCWIILFVIFIQLLCYAVFSERSFKPYFIVLE